MKLLRAGNELRAPHLSVEALHLLVWHKGWHAAISLVSMRQAFDPKVARATASGQRHVCLARGEEAPKHRHRGVQGGALGAVRRQRPAEPQWQLHYSGALSFRPSVLAEENRIKHVLLRLTTQDLDARQPALVSQQELPLRAAVNRIEVRVPVVEDLSWQRHEAGDAAASTCRNLHLPRGTEPDGGGENNHCPHTEQQLCRHLLGTATLDDKGFILLVLGLGRKVLQSGLVDEVCLAVGGYHRGRAAIRRPGLEGERLQQGPGTLRDAALSHLV
mmetsp:Transcript_129796/g.307968  ORF Transcript_129796/g.307968 Transcript_129796/m.307968 type:complete len:274 (-) Transcript_129796:3-824(-)